MKAAITNRRDCIPIKPDVQKQVDVAHPQFANHRCTQFSMNIHTFCYRNINDSDYGCSPGHLCGYCRQNNSLQRCVCPNLWILQMLPDMAKWVLQIWLSSGTCDGGRRPCIIGVGSVSPHRSLQEGGRRVRDTGDVMVVAEVEGREGDLEMLCYWLGDRGRCTSQWMPVAWSAGKAKETDSPPSLQNEHIPATLGL